MKRIGILAAGVCAAAFGANLFAAAPKAAAPAPIANYWMDVATTSGFGAGQTLEDRIYRGALQAA